MYAKGLCKAFGFRRLTAAGTTRRCEAPRHPILPLGFRRLTAAGTTRRCEAPRYPILPLVRLPSRTKYAQPRGGVISGTAGLLAGLLAPTGDLIFALCANGFLGWAG